METGKAAFTPAAPSLLPLCPLPAAPVPGALLRWPAALVRVTWVASDKLSGVQWRSWRACCQQEAFGLAVLFTSVVPLKVAWLTVVLTHTHWLKELMTFSLIVFYGCM